MKTALSKIWTVWCVIVITTVVLLLLPVFALAVHSGIPSWKIWAHKLVLRGARIVLFLWGVRYEVHNRELVDPKKQYVYVGNHRSDLDAIITLAAVRGYWKYLGKAELLKYPIIGYLVGQLYITVDRKSRESREESIRQMLQQAQDGVSITIFPEGWSNFSSEYLLPFKQGAFGLAIKAGIPMAVFTVINSFELWPKPYWRVTPGKVHFYWEGVIETEGLENGNKEHLERLKQQVADLWLKRLKEHYPDGFQYLEGWPDFNAWMEMKLGKRPGDRLFK